MAYDESGTRNALFPRWSNAAARATIIVVALVILGVPVALMAWMRTPAATGHHRDVMQPIPFDHRIHANDEHIDCQYCHFSAAHAASAGLPPTTLCVSCHSDAYLKSPVFAPVRQSLSTGVPIRWNRVDALPGFVYFNHSIHVAREIACEACHGDVAGMQRVSQSAPLTMQWCVDCHRAPPTPLKPAPTNCTTCHR
jgi:hypothetical protein